MAWYNSYTDTIIKNSSIDQTREQREENVRRFLEDKPSKCGCREFCTRETQRQREAPDALLNYGCTSPSALKAYNEWMDKNQYKKPTALNPGETPPKDEEHLHGTLHCIGVGCKCDEANDVRDWLNSPGSKFAYIGRSKSKFGKKLALCPCGSDNCNQYWEGAEWDGKNGEGLHGTERSAKSCTCHTCTNRTPLPDKDEKVNNLEKIKSQMDPNDPRRRTIQKTIDTFIQHGAETPIEATMRRAMENRNRTPEHQGMFFDHELASDLGISRFTCRQLIKKNGIEHNAISAYGFKLYSPEAKDRLTKAYKEEKIKNPSRFDDEKEIIEEEEKQKKAGLSGTRDAQKIKDKFIPKKQHSEISTIPELQDKYGINPITLNRYAENGLIKHVWHTPAMFRDEDVLRQYNTRGKEKSFSTIAPGENPDDYYSTEELAKAANTSIQIVLGHIGTLLTPSHSHPKLGNYFKKDDPHVQEYIKLGPGDKRKATALQRNTGEWLNHSDYLPTKDLEGALGTHQSGLKEILSIIGHSPDVQDPGGNYFHLPTVLDKMKPFGNLADINVRKQFRNPKTSSYYDSVAWYD